MFEKLQPENQMLHEQFKLIPGQNTVWRDNNKGWNIKQELESVAMLTDLWGYTLAQQCFELNSKASMLICLCLAGVMLTVFPVLVLAFY